VAPWAFSPEVSVANTRLSMRKIEEVLRLHHDCGRSNREIIVDPNVKTDFEGI
jgi:hypothetical protein